MPSFKVNKYYKPRTVCLLAASFVDKVWELSKQPVKGSQVNQRFGARMRRLGMNIDMLVGHPDWKRRIHTHLMPSGGWIFLPMKVWDAMDEVSKALAEANMDVFTQAQPGTRCVRRSAFSHSPSGIHLLKKKKKSAG